MRTRLTFNEIDDDPIDDLLPSNLINTKTAETTFEASDMARAA